MPQFCGLLSFRISSPHTQESVLPKSNWQARHKHATCTESAAPLSTNREGQVRRPRTCERLDGSRRRPRRVPPRRHGAELQDNGAASSRPPTGEPSRGLRKRLASLVVVLADLACDVGK